MQIKITTRRTKHAAQVLKDGKVVKSFNYLAEDYANVEADKYANNLRGEMSDNKALQVSETRRDVLK